MRRLIILVTLLMAQSGLAEDKAPPAESTESTESGGDPSSFQPTNSYVHQWMKMPEVSGQSVRDASTAVIKGRPGRVSVVIFMASYDEPSQQLVLDFMRLERQYETLHTDFYYVFSHDTREDALGFMEEFGIKRGVLSNHSILKEYHNPDLPTIFIGDRHGWLNRRFTAADKSKIAELEVYLRHLTAL